MQPNPYTNGNGSGQSDLAALTADLRALRDLATGLAKRIEAATSPHSNGNGQLDLSRITPDQLLDAWMAARGHKAEAYLFGRICRRRARRAVNGNGNYA